MSVGWMATGGPVMATHVRARAPLPANAGLIEAVLIPDLVFDNGFEN